MKSNDVVKKAHKIGNYIRKIMLDSILDDTPADEAMALYDMLQKIETFFKSREVYREIVFRRATIADYKKPCRKDWVGANEEVAGHNNQLINYITILENKKEKIYE